jgi:two-component system OmpR family sensor kinase
LRSLAAAGDTTVDLPTTVLERPPPRARSLSLVARLTISYAVQLVAALCVVAALAVQLTRSHLDRELDGRLRAIAESFEQGPARDVTSPEELTAAARAWLAALPQPADQVVVVRTASGEVLSTASSLDLRTLPGGADLVAADVGKFWRLEGPGGDVRALSVPLTLDGQPAGTLVTAASTADITDRVSDLMRWILVAAGVGSAFAIAVAAVTVRRSLRPLSRMTDEVDAVQRAGDLGRRVTQDGRADEVGRLTAAFNGTLARLERAFSSQRQFVTDASHELRTPLTVARGQIELLGEAMRQSTESDRSLVLVQQEIDRMGRIVEDLLLLARLDEGLPLASVRVEVDLVVREALLRALPPSGVPVSVEIDPELCVLADPDRLLQVLTNLVVNAVHHGGDNVHLHICGRRKADRVAIEVADDGPGIPGDELPLIFERFYRTAATRAQASTGSGLGLAIVRSLVEQMGGGVVARSVAGEGTTLIVTLRPAP